MAKSMETKMVLGGICFFLVLAALAYPGVPHVAEAIRRLGQGPALVKNDSESTEQETTPHL